jgi:hypothetical protein
MLKFEASKIYTAALSVATNPKSPLNSVREVIYYFIVTYFNIFISANSIKPINPFTPTITIRLG